MTVILTVALGGLYWFSDDLMELASSLTGDEPVPMSAKPVRRQPAVAVQPPAVALSVPAPVASQAQVAPQAPVAQASQASQASQAPAASVQPAPAPSVAEQTAAPPPPAAAAPVPASEPFPAPAPPAEIADTAPPAPALTEAEQRDLPAVMDRIRREKQARVLRPTAPIMHGAEPVSSVLTTGAVSVVEAPAGVTVSMEHAPVRDAMGSGYRALLNGQYETALGFYASAAVAEPRSAAAHLGKGTALHKLRRYSEARSEYEQVLAIDSGNPEAMTNLMAIIANDSPGQALDELRHLQSISPGFSPVAAQIGGILAQSGDLAGAINQLDMALALSPDNGLYRLNLAIVQDRAGMSAEALASYQRALDSLNGAQSLPIAIDQIRDRIRFLEKR